MGYKLGPRLRYPAYRLRASSRNLRQTLQVIPLRVCCSKPNVKSRFHCNRTSGFSNFQRATRRLGWVKEGRDERCIVHPVPPILRSGWVRSSFFPPKIAGLHVAAEPASGLICYFDTSLPDHPPLLYQLSRPLYHIPRSFLRPPFRDPLLAFFTFQPTFFTHSVRRHTIIFVLSSLISKKQGSPTGNRFMVSEF